MSWWVGLRGAAPDYISDIEVPDSYDRLFRIVMAGCQVDWLDGQVLNGGLCDLLRHAISLLGTDEYPDEWAATPGNVGYMLSRILSLTDSHPGATLEVRHTTTLASLVKKSPILR